MISIMVANKFVNKKNVLITLSALLMCLGSNNAHSQAKGAPKGKPEAIETTKKKTTGPEGNPVETFKGEIKTRATEITAPQILGRGKEATHSAPEVKVNKNTTRPTIESTLGEAPATKLSASQIIEQAPLSKRIDPDVVAEAKKAMIEFGNNLADPSKGGIEANDPALIGLGKIKEYTAEFLSEKKDFTKDGANEALSKAVDKFVREKAYTDSSGRIVNREAAIQALAKKENISIEEATKKIDEQIKAERDQLCKCAGCRV